MRKDSFARWLGLASAAAALALSHGARADVLDTEAPAATVSPSQLVVFARGTDGALWHRFYNYDNNPNGRWSDWYSLGGDITSGPAATVSSSQLVVFARGTDGAVWHKWYNYTPTTGGWSDWSSLGGDVTSGPAATVSPSQLVVFARGTDGAIWHRWYNYTNNPGGQWSGWVSLGRP